MTATIGKMNIYLTDREKNILSLIAEQNLSVSELSRELNVSSVTIRNDLSSLEEKGYLVRTWGGAFPTFHPDMMERQRRRVDEKNRIARHAASFVDEGDTVMIEAGTTTALVAKYLFGKRDINIVTNSALVLPYSRANPALKLTVVGGEFRPSTESLVGPSALRELEQFHVRIAFLGTDGFSFETGLTTHLVEGAEIVRRMARQARRTVVVADSGKFGKTGFVKVLPLEEISALVTDSGIPEDFRSECEKRGVELHVV